MREMRSGLKDRENHGTGDISSPLEVNVVQVMDFEGLIDEF